MSRHRLGALLALTMFSLGLVGMSPSRAVAGPSTPAVPAVAPADPGSAGPLAVTATEYNDGDTAFTPSGFGHAVEVRASVHYPTGLPGGPYPLIVLLHGRHSTCYQGSSAFLEWPCTGGHQTIPSFQGYDYLATNLASWGYIVISVSSNGINAFDNSAGDLGADARARLLQHHLDRWKTFSTTGGAPLGTTFVGKVDLTRVGTMGHSRGGEGVVQQYLLNASLGSPYGIKAVLPLAPVDFNRPVINNVPLDVILPYCDGDVSDLQGVHFYDDARYNVAGDQSPKYTLLVMGANHNFFNTIWTPGGWPAGTDDDWSFTGGSSDPQCKTGAGGHRLTAVAQRNVGLAYMAGFFRLSVGGETGLAPYFDGSATQPASIGTADVHASYQAPDSAATRRDVNRFLTSAALTTNQLGGAVTKTGITPADLCGGSSPQPSDCLSGAGSAQQPHTTPSALSSKRGLSQLRFGWTTQTASLANTIPTAARDVSAYQAVSFRIGLNFADARNPGTARDLSVRLTDSAGGTHSEPLSTWSDALFAPPGNTFFTTPKVFLNTVRIPLSAFIGVDLHKVKTVALELDRLSSGAVLMTDLAFADAAAGSGASLSVNDVTKTEGSQGGTKSFAFTVTLSAALATPVSVTVATANGTAIAPGDYTTKSTVVTIPAGLTTAPFKMRVVEDTTSEPNETFTVNLSAPSGATISDPQGTGTITNDDG